MTILVMSDAAPTPSTADEPIPVTITGITGPAQIHQATLTGVPGPSTATINVQSYDPNADEDDDDDDDEGGGGDGPPRKKRGGHGRRKIEIEYIEDKIRRHITFSKRKAGISKKAYELSRLTGAQVRVAVRVSFAAGQLPCTCSAHAAAPCTSTPLVPPALLGWITLPRSSLACRAGAAAHLLGARPDLLICDAQAAAHSRQRKL